MGKGRLRLIMARIYKYAASGLAVAARRLTVARRFNAGNGFNGLKVPQGRLKTGHIPRFDLNFSRPFRLVARGGQTRR